MLVTGWTAVQWVGLCASDGWIRLTEPQHRLRTYGVQLLRAQSLAAE